LGAPPATPFGGGLRQAAPSAGGFGQATPAAGGSFGQGAPAAGGFGQAAPAAGAFSFGAPTTTPAAPPGLTLRADTPSFQFGSAVRASAPPAQPAIAEEDEAPFDYEAAKREALAAAPVFGGGGARPGARGALGGRGAGRAGRGAPEDPEDAARRAERAARFGVKAAAPPPPPPSAAGGAYVAPGLRGRAPPPHDDADDAGAAGAEDDEDIVRGGGRGPIVGTCEYMCPAAERTRRAGMADVAIFERVDPADATRTSPELAVKRFARTVDDPRPGDFRTRGALARTMAYLRALLDRPGAAFGMVHRFLWDRYRSVRQDLYIQGFADAFAVSVMEEIVRFHVLCEHELCGGDRDQSAADVEGFNSHLNVEQANKALISLLELYEKAAAAGRPTPAEPEFRAYHLLSLMAGHGKFRGDQRAFLGALRALRPEVRAAPPVQWALRLRRALAEGNHARFFALARAAPYLLACAAHTHFPAARGRALRVLSEALPGGAARPAAVELAWLRETLALGSDAEAAELAAAHGFSEVADEGGGPAALLYRGQYADPPPPAPRRPSAWISAKAPPLRSQAVTTPAAEPLGPEELAAAAERERAAAAASARAAAEARAAAAADAERRRLAAAAAAAEAAATDEARRTAEDEARRRAEADAAQANATRLAAAQQQEAAARREAERAAAEEAARRAAAEAQRQEEDRRRREAEEAERRRRAEEERRRQEAERQRREAEEAERRRVEEEARRLREEEERRRREAAAQRDAEYRRGLQRAYWRRWVTEAARRAADRARRERIAASLKACRVGVGAPPAAAAPTEEVRRGGFLARCFGR
jgi:hypothetical protein